MTERLFPTIKKQALFLKELELRRKGNSDMAVQQERSGSQQDLVCEDVDTSLSTGACVTARSHSPVTSDENICQSSTFVLGSFPPVIRVALQNQSEELKCARRTKIKTMLIQVLFDKMCLISMYPSHRQYVEFLSNFISTFPFLREKIGSGYDALHESLKNKMKKERRTLVNDEMVMTMKKKFSVVNSGRKRLAAAPPEELQNSQKTRREEAEVVLSDIGEDERSIASHTQAMSVEVGKARPNIDSLKLNMGRTRCHRRKFIMDHSTEEIVSEFPCLKIPKLLLWEMKDIFNVEVDQMMLCNMKRFAAKVIEQSPASLLKQTCLTTIGDCLEEEEKKGLQLGAAILLLPSLFKEDFSALFAIEKMAEIPTPTISLMNCGEGKPLLPERIAIHMDGIQIVHEDVSMDLPYALGVVFSLYYVYGIAYPKTLTKTLLFLERFIFKTNTGKSLPITIGRVYNSLL